MLANYNLIGTAEIKKLIEPEAIRTSGIKSGS